MGKTQLNIRLTEKQKSQIEHYKKINGYDTITSYIIDSAMNQVQKGSNVAGKIVTLSLSPAIDYVIQLNDQLNKDVPIKFSSNDRIIYGAGKGIHESMIIDQFGAPTIAAHYSGGFTGDLLENEISKIGFGQIRFQSKTETRINLKLNIKDKNYEVSELPPKLDESTREKMMIFIESLNSRDILSIAGSYNKDDFKTINSICALAFKKGIDISLDLSSKDVLSLLKYRPYLIKPNIFELEAILDSKFTNEKDIIKAMSKMKDQGARNIAVSMGEKGSLLLTEDGDVYKSIAKDKISVISTQGAGDSFVGAFLAKKGTCSIDEQFKWANAAGAATVESMKIANMSQIKKMYKNIEVTKIKELL